MALLVLDVCVHRLGRRTDLVRYVTRQARTASVGLAGRSRDDPFRINARRGETRRDSHSEVLGALGHHPFQLISVGYHGFLFLLRVCRLDFLRLVLCLSRESPRHEPEIQCVLCDFAIFGYGPWLCCRWTPCRPLDEKNQSPSRAMWGCDCRNRIYRYLPCVWLYSEQRALGQHHPCGWSRRTLSLSELLLGNHCGYRRTVFRIDIGFYEHGLSVRGSGDFLFDALHCATVRMDRFVFGGSRVVRSRLSVLALGESRPSGSSGVKVVRRYFYQRRGEKSSMVLRVFEDKVILGQAAAIQAASAIQNAITERGVARVVAASAASQIDFLQALTTA